MRRLAGLRLAVAAAAFAGSAGSMVSVGERTARADVTTWLAFGAGLAVDHSTATHTTNWNPGFSPSFGVGSDPTHAFVLGGVFRVISHINEGADLSLPMRLTTGGYSRGDWGVAFDAGPGLRLWESNKDGTFLLQGAVIFGLPWGLQVNLGSDLVNLQLHPTAVAAYALLEFDLMRFTVTRQGSTDVWWKNPLPAGGRMENRSKDDR